MTVNVIVGDELVRRALERATAPTPDSTGGNGVLFTVPDSPAGRWAERLWNACQEAVLTATRQGLGAAQEWIEKVTSLAEEAHRELGVAAAAAIEENLRRVRAALRTIVEESIQSCLVTIKVDDKVLRASEITVANTIKISGSLAISLSKLCEFVAEGNLVVTAKYVNV